jgi:hypothetical protein
MNHRYLFRFVSVFLFSVIFLSNPVQAAPQVLAVLATDVGVPFVCAGELCKAELSTYCLQRDRPAPNAGTIYHPAAAEDFTLSVALSTGKTRNLPAAEHVTFVEARGFMAISVVIDKNQLRRLGSLNASIRVGEFASMLPEAVPGDVNPLTEKEIAYATGSLRRMGDDIVDRKPTAQSARMLTRVMNTMPVRGTVNPGDQEQLWRDAIGEESTDDIGVGLSKKVYNQCFKGSQSFAYGGIRRCLEFRHDEFIRSLNVDYWDQQPGS